MIKVVAKCTVKPDKKAEFQKITSELIDKTRREKGCIAYELFRDGEEERVFVFVESWENRELLNAHIDSKHCKELLPEMETCYEKEMELHFMSLVK